MPLSADIRIAPSENLIVRSAEHLLQTHTAQLPNLGNIVVLLPGQSACPEFRRELLHQLGLRQHSSIIPPSTSSLQHWVEQTYPARGQRLSEHSRRLLFIEALEQHSQLFREENKWQVTIALLKLFDELNLQQTQLNDSIQNWEKTLQLSYGLQTSHLHLHQEAVLVHTLWQAWQQQLAANQQCDASLAYVQSLQQAKQDLDNNKHFYIVDTTGYSNAELSYLEHLQKNALCTVLDSDNHTSKPHTLAQFIESVFDATTAPLYERCQPEQNITLPFSVFLARDTETETRAVDLQIRKCLLKGARNIGVVCENRKLSRRLRALLERAQVPLQDMAGWSLATTSAAAVIERWLECIETDFDYRVFLDVIKSHFFGSTDREQHLNNVYRLEHDIILHENIAHGLARYKKQLDYRRKRLPHWPNQAYAEIRQLLDTIALIAKPLQALYQSNSRQPLSQHLESLSQSLDALGIRPAFADDAAGSSILQLLDKLQHSTLSANPALSWQDFRSWLGMALEEQLFSPQQQASVVQLMTLEQAQLKRFDALIIAAADEQYLPGSADTSPFFNQAVRRALGLPVWEQQRAQRLLQFKRLLLASDEILISCKSHDHGDVIPLSPWIEALRVHTRLRFNLPLDNTELAALLIKVPELVSSQPAILPPVPKQPSPTAPAQLIPTKISASAHQRLINCPYQYFAADLLSLKPADEISEELQKADYGERVHQILQAFHQPVEHLPPPFTEPVTAANRSAAIAHLETISEQVFARDQQDNLLHRSWQHRWQAHIAAYVDWQIHQQQHARIAATEQQRDAVLNDRISVHGRLDRIDQPITDASDSHIIIDYKTGTSAHQNDVDNGEAVQLVSYAMLDRQAEHVMYLSLDEQQGKVRTRAQLAGDELHTLRDASEQRLLEIFELLDKQHPLTAWGDEHSCQYCDFSGLCRRKVWNR